MSGTTIYSPYLPMFTGFHIVSATHVDNRTVVESIADRDAMSSTRLPDGLECLIMNAVRNEDSIVKYRWYDNEWHPIDHGSGGGGDDFNHTSTFIIDDWQQDVNKPYNKFYIEVLHIGNKYPSHMVFTSEGEGVLLEYKEISTSKFRLYNRHPFDGILTAN